MSGTKGNSGRPRKPTSLKILSGTFQKVRANTNEPKPKVARPKASKGLHPEVKKKFDELVDLTSKMGVLSEYDGIALEILASSLVQYKIASEVLIKEGVVRRSYLVWAENTFKQASSMLAKFGLSPSDRSRVNVINPTKTKESKWDKYK